MENSSLNVFSFFFFSRLYFYRDYRFITYTARERNKGHFAAEHVVFRYKALRRKKKIKQYPRSIFTTAGRLFSLVFL